MAFKRITACLLSLILCVLTGNSAAGTPVVRLTGNTLSLHADRVPLRDILQQLTRQGVTVQIDPHLNPEISASFDNRDIRKGLESVLTPLNHVLIWESVPGTSALRLAEIQVFEPSKKNLMRSLRADANFAVLRNPSDGSYFVRDEILLRRQPGVSSSEFEALLKEIGGVIVERNDALGIYQIRLPENTDVPALVEQIRRNPRIVGAEPNYAYPISLPYKRAGAVSPVSGISDGTVPEGGIPIAVLDSGLLPDAGLGEYVTASLDAVNPDMPISDGLGHGTQMSLIASGLVHPQGVPEGYESPTPVIPIRAFDDNGFTSNFSIMRSIDFAAENGARVLSLSWGTETDSKFMEEALTYAEAKNLIVVAAAGNEPTGKPVYPAAYSSVIGVGALAPDGTPWKSSNYGSFVTLSAPGFADLPVGYQGEPGTYAGTSVATAFVANSIARYLSGNPTATKQEIISSLSNLFENE